MNSGTAFFSNHPFDRIIRFMKKAVRNFILIITSSVFLLSLMLIPGCTSKRTASEICDDFVQSLRLMDFSSAYSCLWNRTGSISRDSFVNNAKAIIDALGITSISVRDTEIGIEKGYDVFKYTIDYHHGDEFTVSNTASLYIIQDGTNFFLKYNKDMLLKDYRTGSKITRTTLTGNRGEIFTSDKTAIAVNDYSETVTIAVAEETNINVVLNRIAAITGMSAEDMVKVRERYNSAVEHNYGEVAAYVYPKGKLPADKREQLEAIDGVYINDHLTPQRYYPYRELYAHIVGYASTANEEQIKSLREQGFETDIIGKTGIEARYDSLLQPKNGFAYRLYNPDGQFVRTLYEQAAVNGADIILTIDHTLQQEGYYLMSSQLSKKQTGVSIVMDPVSGYVKEQISLPSFDPNIFSFPISDAEYEQLTNEESLAPLVNRVTQGLYPPGSTIKPFTVTPALENGIVERYSIFPYKIKNNQWIPSGTWYWDPVTRNETPDADLHLDTAIRFSDNIYFSWVALQMGGDMFMDYMKKIGIGETVPFDIGVAKSNLINEGTDFNRKMLSDMSFGHGELLLSPIQIASMYSVFRNSGNMVVPRLVEKISKYDSEGNEDVLYQATKEYWKTNVMQTDTIDLLTYSLKRVVTNGTAKALKTEGLTLAAKTGTALKGDNKKQKIAWVCTWYQDMDEERLVVVMVDGPRSSNDHRHDIAKVLLRYGH